jgi:hypothetical protein
MQRRKLIAGTLALPFLPPRARADAASAAGRWKPLAIPHRQVFPSLVIATATLDDRGAPADTLGDPHGVLGAEVTAAQAGERLRLTVRAPRLARESTLDTVLPRAAVRYQVFPTMLWHFERLRAQRQAAPETVEFRLRLDDVALPMRALRVRVRSINEVPYFVPGPAGGIDLTWMFAAYVNEDHPLVARILREALALDGIERFDGYQSGDPEQVYRQLFAIWRVLRRRGIRYSSIVRTGAADARVLSQHVRFLEESWASNQANCVDGCVLIASVLRKIDLDPRLVLVPGHMFLAVDLDRGGQERAFIETTLLGEGDGRHEDTDAALANFEAAVARGFQRMQSASERIAARADPEYQLIDLAAARRLGIVPIAAA